jgi:formylglycine-generating enzyme required for sulfatase activity
MNINMRRRSFLHFFFATTVIFWTAMPAQAEIQIEMVTVGNRGNAPDTQWSSPDHGAVDYNFRIGKYEVTNAQFAAFLNAAAKSDPNGLYEAGSPSSPTDTTNDIQRMGSSGNYVYSVAANQANRPAQYLSFWSAARFSNWLHNGQPTGPQGPGTTEDGAYINIGNELTFTRQPDARFWIPNQDEWYKAAFHKNDGVTGNYWGYPTQSNSEPLNTLPDPGNHANYKTEDIEGGTYTIGPPHWRTEVGAFVNSPGPYGTFDQGGNVLEWLETKSDVFHIIAGGSYADNSTDMHASSLCCVSSATDYGASIGFRIAGVVPEPGTALLAMLGIALACCWRRRSAG